MSLVRTTSHRYTGVINVLPHILYCCNTWSKRSRQNIDVLGRLHKRAAYIISRRSCETPSQEVFNELQWPTLDELLDRVMACMVFKCTHGKSNLNVQNGFNFLDDTAQRSTRSSDIKVLRATRCNTEFFYQNIFVNAGIKLWNSLPLRVRFSRSLGEFKRHINDSNNYISSS